MIPTLFFRKLAFVLLIIFSLHACNGSDTSSDRTLTEVRGHLELARVYMNQGQFRASSIEARNALELMPDYIDTRLLIGDLYMELGSLSDAIEHLEAARELAPESTDVLLSLAEAYLYAGRTQEGLDLITDLDVENPERSVRKNWLMGNLQASAGNRSAARAHFQSALESDPDHVDSLISLSKLAYMEGNTNESENLLDQAMEAANTAQNEDVWIWQGQFALLQEDYPAAEEAYYEALDIMSLYDTMTAKRYNTLQSILVPLRLQQKNEEALRYSQILAESPQGQFNNNFSNALSLFQEGSIAEAEEELSVLLEAAPDHPGSNILMGLSRLQQGDYQEAEDLLSRFVDASTASPDLVRTLAATQFQLNKPEQALRILQNALENNPEDETLLAMTGIIQRTLGNFEQARSTLERALELNSQNAELHYTLASVLAQQQNPEAALAQLNEALAINPEFTEAKAAILEIHVSNDSMAAAEETVQQWLEEDPESAFNYNAAGMVAIQTGDVSSAIDHFERTIELEPDNIPARLNLARVALQQEDYGAAEEQYNRVLESSPVNAIALRGILALGDLRESSQQAVDRIRQIMESNPQEFVPPYVLAQYFLTSGNLDNAADYAETAYNLSQNSNTVNTYANILGQQASRAIQEQNTEDARQLIQRALEIQENNAQALAMATNLAFNSQNIAEAAGYIDRLKEVQPASPQTLELEGDLHLTRNEPENALDLYRQAWEAQQGANLGSKIYQVYTRTGQGEQAVEFLDNWLAAQPDQPAPVLYKAMELQGRGEESEAIEYYEQVYENLPENLVVLNNLAWLYQDSNPQRALELAEKAADLYPENAEVLDTYGWILFKQDERQRAVDILERASSLAPDSQAIREHLNVARQQ